jgi:microcystin-dependent protein
MPTLYPTGLDAPSNPTQTTSMAAPGFEHDLQHVNNNDAMRAVQSYVGTANSPVPTSITYISNNNAANIVTLQGTVSTLNQQLTITNANTTANTNAVAANTTSINNLIATKLNLSGGTLTGQLAVSYKPPAVSASLYLSAQILISNTGSGDAPPSLSWQAVGVFGIAIYANASGLNTITGTGGSSLIIDTAGRLNPLSFSDNTLPASKLVNASVTATQLAAASVTGPAIAAGAIDPTKFSSSVYTWCRDNAGCPVGTIALFAGPSYTISNFPNWLPCVGWAISRTTYSTLYAYLGTTWGSGDGSTTFNIPEMRGRFPVGAAYYNAGPPAAWLGGPAPGSTIRYPGGVGGEEVHTLSTGEIPAHAHGVSDPGHAHSVYDPGHAHGISDPGHSHSYNQSPIPGPQIQAGAGDWANRPVSANTGASGTGIGIYGAGTGIGIYAAGTGISIGNAGGGAAHNNMPPWAGVTYMIKVLPN